jgi:hypothetical protein
MRNIAIAIGLILVSAPAYAASSATGSWDVVVTAVQGVFPSTVTFEETDEGYAITVDDAALGPREASDVTVDGDSFSFTRTLDFGRGPEAYVYSGTVEGDAMTGAVDSSIGAMTFAGTRKTPEPAAAP